MDKWELQQQDNENINTQHCGCSSDSTYRSKPGKQQGGLISFITTQRNISFLCHGKSVLMLNQHLVSAFVLILWANKHKPKLQICHGPRELSLSFSITWRTLRMEMNNLMTPQQNLMLLSTTAKTKLDRNTDGNNCQIPSSCSKVQLNWYKLPGSGRNLRIWGAHWVC